MAVTSTEASQTLAREELLDEAKRIVSGVRDEAYGTPEDSFSTIADFWRVYLARRGLIPAGVFLEPHDVANMMSLLKLARLAADPSHEDSYVDLAGYAATGYEVSR